jgi:hypothetical protein
MNPLILWLGAFALIPLSLLRGEPTPADTVGGYVLMVMGWASFFGKSGK